MFEEPNQTLLTEKAASAAASSATDTMTDALELQLTNEEEQEGRAGQEQDKQLPREQGHNSKLSCYDIVM